MKILVFVVAIISSGLLQAETVKFSYPELQVTPLASETLKSAFIMQQKITLDAINTGSTTFYFNTRWWSHDLLSNSRRRC